MVKFIDQWRFKLMGRAVPVVKLEDIDNEGRIYTLHVLGTVKKRANSLISTWDQKGWEIDKKVGKIAFIDEKGIEKYVYLVTEGGKTAGIYTKPIPYPNLEDVIGKGATMDDISDAMDLGKSNRNLIIGILIGCGIGAFILGPLIQGMLS